MKLSHIEAAGFRGIRSTMPVPVPNGFLVVTGRNGSGKSTLLDAIEFGLTGQISRPALMSENREDLGNYTWWRGAGEPSERFVRLVFDLDNGSGLEVERRPEGVSFRTRDGAGDARSLDESGLHACFASRLAPKVRLLERLCGSTIVRDEQITELSVDADERARFSLVLDTLGSTQLPDIEKRLDNTKQVIDHRVRLLQNDYEVARADVNRLVAQISESRSEFDAEPDSEAPRRDLAATLGVAEDKDTDSLMRQARSQISSLRSHVSALLRCISRLQEIESRRAMIETDAYKARSQELDEVLERATEDLTRAQRTRREAETEAGEVEKRRPHVRSLGELLEHGKRVGLEDGRCPLCGSVVIASAFQSHLHETAGRVERESGGLTEALARREEALGNESAAALRKRQAEAAVREHRRAGEDLRVEFDEVVGEVRGMEGVELSATVSATALEAALGTARSSLQSIESALAGLESSTAYARLIEQERALAQERERLASAQKALEAAQRASSHQAEASRAVRRVAGELVDERLAQLEPLLVELYERLRPHVQWSTVGYRVRGDVRRFMRLTVGKSELNPRFMFSSGQRRALGLAFLLSVHLSTTWSRWNTLILDDPMQHVDDYRALHLVEVLGSIRRSGRQILCAVEDRSLADLLARRLATSESQSGGVLELKYELGDGSTIASLDTLKPLNPRLFTAA